MTQRPKTLVQGSGGGLRSESGKTETLLKEQCIRNGDTWDDGLDQSVFVAGRILSIYFAISFLSDTTNGCA